MLNGSLKRKFSKLLIFLCASCLLFLPTNVVLAYQSVDTPPLPPDYIKYAPVANISINWGIVDGISQGTAFVISPQGHMLTNAHVIDPSTSRHITGGYLPSTDVLFHNISEYDYEVHDIEVLASGDASESCTSWDSWTENCYIHNDFALILPKKNYATNSGWLTLKDPSGLSTTSLLHWTGHPHGVLETQYASGYFLKEHQGTNGVKYGTFDALSASGASGSPTFDETGMAVGILTLGNSTTTSSLLSSSFYDKIARTLKPTKPIITFTQNYNDVDDDKLYGTVEINVLAKDDQGIIKVAIIKPDGTPLTTDTFEPTPIFEEAYSWDTTDWTNCTKSGKLTVTVWDDYSASTSEIPITVKNSTELTLENSPPLTLALGQSFTISGSLLESDGTAIAQSEVCANLEWQYCSNTDNDGHFKIDLIAPVVAGSYIATVYGNEVDCHTIQNKLITTIDPVEGYDLEVRNLDHDGGIFEPGDTINLEAMFENLGDQNQDLIVSWYLYAPDGTIHDSSVNNAEGALTPNNPVPKSKSLTLNNDAQHGQWSAFVNINVSQDENLRNNSLEKAFFVGDGSEDFVQYRLHDTYQNEYTTSSYSGHNVQVMNVSDSNCDTRYSIDGDVVTLDQGDSESWNNDGLVFIHDGCNPGYQGQPDMAFFKLLSSPPEYAFTVTGVETTVYPGSDIIYSISENPSNLSIIEDYKDGNTISNWDIDDESNGDQYDILLSVPNYAQAGTYTVLIQFRLDGEYYAQKVSFTVLDTIQHDVAVNSILPVTGSNYERGSQIDISANILSNFNITEFPAVTIDIVNNNGYSHSTTEFQVVLGNSSVPFSYEWNTVGLEAGNYTVSISAAIDDDSDLTNNVMETLLTLSSAVNIAPVADAGGPYAGAVNTPVTFDASGSSDTDGAIISYEWDWDNNGSFDEITYNPIYEYTWPTVMSGTIVLRVTDDNGDSSTDSTHVTITEEEQNDFDQDNDGIPDTFDNCPDTANSNQYDSDQDGIGDICDDCIDIDVDAVCGDVDNCPRDHNPDQTDSNSNGIGDICDIAPFCGNNTIDTGEECDDGNLIDGDGCSSNCQDECTSTDEICDGLDNDCNGFIDDGLLVNTFYTDNDHDGFGDPNATVESCQQLQGTVENNTDCNDNDPNEFPGQTWHSDIDGDGYPDTVTETLLCERPNGMFTSSELTEIVVDNCPNVSNPDQLDQNNDGIGDACDISNDTISASFTYMSGAPSGRYLWGENVSVGDIMTANLSGEIEDYTVPWCTGWDCCNSSNYDAVSIGRQTLVANNVYNIHITGSPDGGSTWTDGFVELPAGWHYENIKGRFGRVHEGANYTVDQQTFTFHSGLEYSGCVCSDCGRIQMDLLAVRDGYNYLDDLDTVLHYKFNEGSSGSAIGDITLYRNDGVAVNTSWSAFSNTQSLNFNGAKSYVQIEQATTLRPDNITLEVVAGSEAWSGKNTFISQRYNSSDNESFLLGYDADMQELYARFMVDTGSAIEQVTINGNCALTNGTFNHIAVTFNDGICRLYLNHQEIANEPITGVITYKDFEPIRLGYDQQASGGGDYFNGDLFEVKISRTSLPPHDFISWQDIVFEEYFNNDLSQWSIAGYPAPSILSTQGNPAPAFSTNDDLSYSGYAVAKQSFDYDNGIILSADIKPGHASYPDQRFAQYFLSKNNTISTSGSSIVLPGNIIRVVLTADDYGTTPGWGTKTPGPWISFHSLYDDHGSEMYERAEEIKIPSGSGWHNIRVEIRQDLLVAFYLDDQLLHTSTQPIPSIYSGESSIGIGGRLSYYDNIKAGYSLFEVQVPPAELIIDNGDPETSYTGTWPTSGGLDYYGTKSVYSKTTSATHRYEAPLIGDYELSLWWTEWSSRCTNVPVEIYDGPTLIDTLTVNQKTDGGQWNVKGSYTFTGTCAIVVVSGSSACSTNADAVRLLEIP